MLRRIIDHIFPCLSNYVEINSTQVRIYKTHCTRLFECFCKKNALLHNALMLYYKFLFILVTIYIINQNCYFDLPFFYILFPIFCTLYFVKQHLLFCLIVFTYFLLITFVLQLLVKLIFDIS